MQLGALSDNRFSLLIGHAMSGALLQLCLRVESFQRRPYLQDLLLYFFLSGLCVLQRDEDQAAGIYQVIRGVEYVAAVQLFTVAWG